MIRPGLRSGVKTAERVPMPDGYPQTARQKLSLNQDWRFHLGELPGEPFAVEYDDSKWDSVNVPHTLKLTSLGLDGCQDDKTQPTFQRDFGWYRRTLDLESPGERKVFLEFEGAHQVTDLWVNGRHIGQHAIGGYTPFHFDITDSVHAGKNLIALKVDNRKNPHTPPDPGPFDFIKFSGLYRDVYLVLADPLHVTFPWESLGAGITVTTPSVDPLNGNATIDVKTQVRNDSNEARQCRVLTRVIDAQGTVVLRMESTETISPGNNHTFDHCGGITEDLHLWSCEDPYLYRVNTVVYSGDQAVDCVENPLGVRKVEINRHDGVLLNGKPIKLQGVNRHQHFPYIGDAVPDALHFKDALQLKKAGFNIVRLAHYPHDDAFLDACDRLGLLAYEEAPTWIMMGDAKWFDNLESALRRAIRNHRNHPSIIMWGGGINHRGAVERLHFAAKQEDPTRWTASNNSAWTGSQDSGVCDIYANMDYGNMEEFDGAEPLFAMESGVQMLPIIASYKGDPLKIGYAAWTAHAYYTFHQFDPDPGVDPGEDRTRLGMMDVFRKPKDDYEWYEVELAKEPALRIMDDWKPGIKELRIYSNCDEIELIVNGKSLGRRKVVREGELAHLNNPPFAWPVERFEPGEVVAKGYRGGKPVAEDRARTPEAPHHIELVVDMAQRQFTADGSDIVVAYARVMDANGTLVRDGRHAVKFTVDGPAGIVGDGTEIGANPIRSLNGVASALVRAGKSPGKIVLRAEADGMSAAEATFESISWQADRTAADAKPIFDPKKTRIDLGGSGQLLQFDWTAWNGADDTPTSLALAAWGNAELRLSSGSKDGRSLWLGEMNIIGRNGFAFGDGICVIDPDGMILEIRGLPAGRYALKTSHHAPRANTNEMDPNKERLKTLKVTDIPPATVLSVSVNGAAGIEVSVTTGKKLPKAGPGQAHVDFESDGADPVLVRFRSADGKRGIWLNAIELSERP